jgi:hypothetical protein
VKQVSGILQDTGTQVIPQTVNIQQNIQQHNQVIVGIDQEDSDQ